MTEETKKVDNTSEILERMVLMAIRGYRVSISYSKSNGFLIVLDSETLDRSYMFATDNPAEELERLLEVEDFEQEICHYTNNTTSIGYTLRSDSTGVIKVTSVPSSYFANTGYFTVSPYHAQVPLPKGSHYRFWRDPDGQAKTNVPIYAVLHSPTGYEWGYSGSGPSDLAINIIEDSLRRIGYSGVRTDIGLFDITEKLGVDFKAIYIATMARSGGAIPTYIVDNWVNAKLRSIKP